MKYGYITAKGVSISFSLGSVSTVSTVSTVGCNVDTARVTGVDNPIHSVSTVSTPLEILEDKSVESVDKSACEINSIIC